MQHALIFLGIGSFHHVSFSYRTRIARHLLSQPVVRSINHRRGLCPVSGSHGLASSPIRQTCGSTRPHHGLRGVRVEPLVQGSTPDHGEICLLHEQV